MIFVEVGLCNKRIVSTLRHDNDGIRIEARIGVGAQFSFPLGDPSAEEALGVQLGQ